MLSNPSTLVKEIFDISLLLMRISLTTNLKLELKLIKFFESYRGITAGKAIFFAAQLLLDVVLLSCTQLQEFFHHFEFVGDVGNKVKHLEEAFRAYDLCNKLSAQSLANHIYPIPLVARRNLEDRLGINMDFRDVGSFFYCKSC